MDEQVSADRGRFEHLICLAALMACGAIISLPSVSAQPLVTVSPPVPLRTDPGPDTWTDYNPQLLTNGTGTWLVFWFTFSDFGDQGIVFARSTDNGATWSEPKRLAEHGRTLRVFRGGSETLIAAWTTTDDPDGTLGEDYDIRFARSVDFGNTWSDNVPLNTNATGDAADDAIPHLVTDGNGRWLAVWSAEDVIQVSRSTNDGISWTAPVRLTPEGTGEYYAQVVANDDGSWLVVWTSYIDWSKHPTLNNVRDILFARSTDHGATWTDPAPLRNDATNRSQSWALDTRVRIRQDQSGNLIAVWNHWVDPPGFPTDFRVKVARSTDGGRTWSDPVSFWAHTSYKEITLPLVETGESGRWVLVWRSDDSPQDEPGFTHSEVAVSDSMNGALTWSTPKLVHQTPRDDPFALGCKNAATQLVYDNRGNWFLLWETCDDLDGSIGDDRDLLGAISSDHGATWSEFILMNPDAGSDGETTDESAQLATDGQGHWVLAWTADGTLTVSRFALPDCNGNYEPDDQDLADGTSRDCNGNGLPDECDIAAGLSEDCNANGIPDECDLADGDSLDLNANAIPDECEPDCNQNGVPDDLDMTTGLSEDCNTNGIPDECETDCNENGIPDECDLADGVSLDLNANAIPDECEPAPPAGGIDPCAPLALAAITLLLLVGLTLRSPHLKCGG